MPERNGEKQMKWNNKGHEFDNRGRTLAEDFKRGQKIYLFGAGILGEEFRGVLEAYGIFGGYIDNDRKKQQAGAGGADVISVEGFMEKRQDSWVVICADDKNIPAMQKQMESNGMQTGKDLFVYLPFFRDIFPVLSLWAFHKVFDNLCQISLTERCTLRCGKCAHGCYAVGSDARDMDPDDVRYTADSYFSHVDFIREFVLIGGEPLLYRHLAEAITYIGEHYRNQMMIYSITTNGTVMPDEDVLLASKAQSVLFRISNYSDSLPRLKPGYERLCRLLEAYGIAYVLEDGRRQWYDYGFEEINRESASEAAAVFDGCRTPCREVRRDKYYYCVMARTVNDNLKFGLGENDYLSLSGLKGESGKKILTEYGQGYSDKGYLDMCLHCRGAEAQEHLIPAARQKE